MNQIRHQHGQQQCSACQLFNTASATVCTYCGTRLQDNNLPDTVPISDEDHESDVYKSGITGHLHKQDEHYLRDTWFPADGTLRLFIELNGEDYSMPLQLNGELSLGRAGGSGLQQPDVDLSNFDAYQNGVSRIHAKIVRSSEGYLYVMDLGSSNGTQLNGEQLPTQRPFTLHDGDTIHLGNLKVRLYFH